jgi:hypothetical protein
MAIEHGSRLVRRKKGSRKNQGHNAAQDLQVESLYHRKCFRLFGITLSEGGETRDGTRPTILQKEGTASLITNLIPSRHRTLESSWQSMAFVLVNLVNGGKLF